MHKTHKRQILAHQQERQALIATLMSGKTEYGHIASMSRPEAEKLASAVLTKGFDLLKTWKIRPGEFKQPVKYGLKNSFTSRRPT